MYRQPSSREKKIAYRLIDKLMKQHFDYALTFHPRLCAYDNIDSVEYEWGYFDWKAKYRKWTSTNHINTEYGMSKICIYSSELPNWVIKVDINYDNKIDCDSEIADTCDREYEMFKLAVDEGIDKFFASTFFLRKCGSYKFYLQECAYPDEQRSKELMVGDQDWFEGTEEERQDYLDDVLYEMPDEDRMANLFAEEDPDELQTFLDFIEQNDINDLHESNVGYTKDCRWVLIDFCGYHG